MAMAEGAESSMRIVENFFFWLFRIPFFGRRIARAANRLKGQVQQAMMRAFKDEVRPRNWSNVELRKFAPLYDGDVINVSGWRDEDKTGSLYREYFTAARSYAISNFVGERGFQGLLGEVALDLEGEIPEALRGRYQVVFNHTTLEHIYDIRKALANLCSLSCDTVILVTPFIQLVHTEPGSYGDYWRPSPMALERMLAESGFEVLHQSSNDNAWYFVYIFTLASRYPERWRARIPSHNSAADSGIKMFSK
jgi:hypothetical protein